jgi:hypothetical protein
LLKVTDGQSSTGRNSIVSCCCHQLLKVCDPIAGLSLCGKSRSVLLSELLEMSFSLLDSIWEKNRAECSGEAWVVLGIGNTGLLLSQGRFWSGAGNRPPGLIQARLLWESGQGAQASSAAVLASVSCRS